MESTAVLLIDCPDRPGLVARVATLLYEHGANILHADQHQDHELGLFFMRVEWGGDAATAEPSHLSGQKSPGGGLGGDQGTNATAQSSRAGSFDMEAFQREFARLAGE